MINMAFAI